MGNTTNHLKARIHTLLEDDLAGVESVLRADIGSQVDLIAEVSGHLTSAGGKRLRPMLMLLAGRIAGYVGPRAVNLAAVVELIHTSTLLHDDVIDQAGFRRGLPATNTVFGNKAAVLVGDWLYARAFARMVEDGNLRIVAGLTAATVMMVEGEVRQLRMSRTLSLDEQDYLMVVDRKTARLIAACCRAGAVLGEVGEAGEDALESYGYNLGLAYQIADDSLDYIADEAVLGKSLGNDLREGKVTLPLINLLRDATAGDLERIRGVVTSTDPSEDDLAWVIGEIRASGAATRALATATGYAEKAKSFLAFFPSSEARELLEGIADYTTTRPA
jgi:octaprenyl-diphosphate synthase